MSDAKGAVACFRLSSSECCECKGMRRMHMIQTIETFSYRYRGTRLRDASERVRSRQQETEQQKRKRVMLRRVRRHPIPYSSMYFPLQGAKAFTGDHGAGRRGTRRREAPIPRRRDGRLAHFISFVLLHMRLCLRDFLFLDFRLYHLS